MDIRNQQEKIYTLSGSETANATIAELTIVPPSTTVFIQSLSVLMNVAGAANSTVYISSSAAATTPLVSVAATGTALATSADSRGYAFRNTSSTTAVKLLVRAGATAPGQAGTVVVRHSRAPFPA